MDTSPDLASATPPALLSPIEARILGSLVEKEATTPDAYPLTLNSLVLACNQKTSRDPVTHLNAGEIEHALRQMEVRGLVKSQHSARAGRYAHRMEAVLSLTRQQTALLALLMLRGPQTLHELLSRSERWVKFEGAEDVQHALERLAAREPAMAVKLPRGSGQREDRYGHLLCGPLSEAQLAAAARPSAAAADEQALLERIDALETRIAALEAKLSAAS
ncbi:YceH family protein [Luteimonas sp. SX5]|uniref:YceH family protein n=1 Tax=Luteimonas galliterrae TaxID=2940486 RepID=A0ABT0MI22_9GAMM|nr:YceH family protein [Luteimonas galliterrae]MCL1634531.1 YceH family protein [Luteimonas galliterrae]